MFEKINKLTKEQNRNLENLPFMRMTNENHDKIAAAIKPEIFKKALSDAATPEDLERFEKHYTWHLVTKLIWSPCALELLALQGQKEPV